MTIPKRKNIYLPLVISLALVLSLLGLAGCPVSQTYSLTTNVSPNGTGSVSPSGGDYDPGVTVTITATAASGYIFDYWSGSASGTNPTTTIVMDAHKDVTANFTPAAQTYTLTTNVSPGGAGSVSPTGGDYDDGTSVTLTATAASGYVFDYWSGSTSGTSPTATVVMDEDKNVTANFVASGPTILFSDDFSQDTGDWDVFSDSSGEVFYEGGSIHVMNYTSGLYDTYTQAYRNFSDFILEVELKLIDGTDNNWEGVMCRYQDVENYYVLSISADGYYNIARFLNGEQTSLTGAIYSSYINLGWDVVNTIHIECIGSSLSLSVNGYLLETVTDSSFSSGDIGFVATSYEGSYSEVTFDNLVITEP